MTTTMPDLGHLVAAEVKRRKRRKVFAKFIENLLVYAIVLPLRALWLMLAVGIAHAEWVPQLPTIGYWWSVLIIGLLAGTFGPIIPTDAKDKS